MRSTKELFSFNELLKYSTKNIRELISLTLLIQRKN